MSYILDALRKADAERERDPARGIHAQPAASAPQRPLAPVPGWIWPLATVVVAAFAVYLAWQREADSAAPALAVQGVVAPALLRAEPAAPVIVPVATTVNPPPPAMPAVQRPAPERLVVKAAPVRAAAGPVAPPAALVASAATTAAAAPVAPASAVTVAAAAPAAAPAAVPAAAGRVYAVAELPADVQRELPKLAISGGVHSDNAAQRMLIVGGQVMAEGAELAPGVVLEQIRARTAVLRFRGWRYSVAY
jgi:general secretion pathway protein B